MMPYMIIVIVCMVLMVCARHDPGAAELALQRRLRRRRRQRATMTNGGLVPVCKRGVHPAELLITK